MIQMTTADDYWLCYVDGHSSMDQAVYLLALEREWGRECRYNFRGLHNDSYRDPPNLLNTAKAKRPKHKNLRTAEVQGLGLKA